MHFVQGQDGRWLFISKWFSVLSQSWLEIWSPSLGFPFLFYTRYISQLILYFSLYFDRVVSFDYVDFVLGYNQMFKVVGNKIIEIQLVTIMVSKKLTFDHHLLIDL